MASSTSRVFRWTTYAGAVARTPRSADLPLNPDHPGEGPLPQRLAAQVRDLVADGTLHAGDPLPSTRALATRLGVARGSIVAAFDQLTAEGYLEAVRGSGTRVHPDLAHLPRPGGPQRTDAPARGDGTGRRPPMPGAAAAGGPGSRRSWAHSDGFAASGVADTSGLSCVDVRPGVGPSTPTSAPWRRAWREAAADQADPRRDPLGSPALRRAAANRLRRVRAVRTDPDLLVVTAGARDGLRLLLDALGTRPLTVAFESPGYPSLRRVPALLGHRIVDAPVDEQGLDPDRIPTGIDVLVVTPSHQYPLGGSLPVQRRLAILERARADGFLIVEDDHTAEWRWEGAPLPALTGLDDPNDPRVVLLTSFSSHIGSTIAAGHMLIPAQLRERIAAVRGVLACPLGATSQGALGRMLARGDLDRAAQRARAQHRRRLGMLQDRLAGAPGLEVQSVPGGLSAVVHTARPERELLARAEERGVLVGGLADYWAGRSPRDGIVIGFGGADDELAAGLDRLIAAAR